MLPQWPTIQLLASASVRIAFQNAFRSQCWTLAVPTYSYVFEHAKKYLFYSSKRNSDASTVTAEITYCERKLSRQMLPTSCILQEENARIESYWLDILLAFDILHGSIFLLCNESIKDQHLDLAEFHKFLFVLNFHNFRNSNFSCVDSVEQKRTRSFI